MAELISESLFHKTLNGMEMIRRREATGLTQAQFADKCGWSASYQCQLERIGGHEISVETAHTILRVLGE